MGKETDIHALKSVFRITNFLTDRLPGMALKPEIDDFNPDVAGILLPSPMDSEPSVRFIFVQGLIYILKSLRYLTLKFSVFLNLRRLTVLLESPFFC